MGLDMFLSIRKKPQNIEKIDGFVDIEGGHYQYREKEDEHEQKRYEEVGTINEIMLDLEKLLIEHGFDFKEHLCEFASFSDGHYTFRVLSKGDHLHIGTIFLVAKDVPKFSTVLQKEVYFWEEEGVCYWRKANQIRNWFDSLPHDDTDGNIIVHVSLEELQDLIDLCKKVLAAKGTPEAEKIAEEHLPTSSGFFFGSQEYDDWYYEQLKETIESLEPLTEIPEDAEYVYTESW